jgi:hypothetical protein
MWHPHIKKWEDAATLPVVDVPFIWRGRRPYHSDPAPEEALKRSQRDRRRKRTVAVYGLRLSLLLGLLVGWVYAEVNPLGGGSGAEPCTEVGSALGPTIKRKIRESLGTRGAPKGQDNALSMRVCDPQLLAMLPTLGAEIAQAPEFREMAKLFKRGEDDLSTMSLLKTLISSGAKRGP